MRSQRKAVLFFTALVSLVTYGQLFHSLELKPEIGERQGEFSQPRMHIEGDRLYVCTNRGLYTRDLSNNDGSWLLAGFENIPLQDYVRRDNDILALRYNKGGGFLLLSQDDGLTYKDVTPEIFCDEKCEILPCLVQHPTDPNTLLTSSLYWGIFRSTDFSQTWENLTESFYTNRSASFIGFHPKSPSVIYNSGEGETFKGHINISYDAGQTWNDHGESLGFHGDNCVHRPAFHPTNPNYWVVGGEGVIYTTTDNGHTWNCQNFWDDAKRSAYWYFSAFDEEHPDTIYMVGNTTGNLGAIKVMYSTDGGISWSIPQTEPRKKASIERINDLLQYGDKLLIYTESDVYALSKADLIEQTTSINEMKNEGVKSEKYNDAIYDLSGRKIANGQKPMSKGLYIVNGKKVAVKKLMYDV